MFAIIGDVHGCAKTAAAILKKIPADHEPIFLGDLIDRGPDCLGVVDLVMQGGYRCLMGNHEHMAVDYWDKTRIYGSSIWEMNGGNPSLPWEEKHKDFLRNLPLYFEFDEGKVLASHAPLGGNLQKYISKEALDSSGHPWRALPNILWYRGYPKLKEGIFNIHGHNKQPQPEQGDNWVNIDTSCYLGVNGDAHGRLTAFLWPSKEIITATYCE